MKLFKTFIFAALALATATSCSSSSKDNADNNAQEEVAQPQAPDTSWMPDSVTVLPSGLGIIIENPGDSTRANENSQVTVHYKGQLTNGTVFDSSYDRGEPATFSPMGVVPGFGEGIRQIGKGGKATLYIPSQLGYGERGAAPVIGPNENLIFDIEVVDIQN